VRLSKAGRIICIAAALCITCSNTPRVYGQDSATIQPAAGRIPVLVELFTSEGCSTCPPADDLLEDLVKHQPIPGAFVIGLGEHVDYWNQLGWTDRFSSSTYSQRQSAYAKNMKASEVYTPQMVINGTSQASGSDRSAVVHAISAAAKKVTAVLTLSRTDQKDAVLRVSVTLSGTSKGDQAGLFAAVTDDDDATMVTGGENGGHSLRYGNTVRSMRAYGPIVDGQAKLLEIQLPPDFTKKKMHLVVFAQSANQGSVLAAASIAI
jgi:hypothetical protein